MKHFLLVMLVSMSAFAASLARPVEIDTVILMARPNGDGYVMQYWESGKDDTGASLIRSGDQVPLLTSADLKVVSPIFEIAAKEASPRKVGTVTLAKVDGGKKYLLQVTTPPDFASPQHEMASPKERKEFEAVFALAKRARTGK